MAAGGQGAPLVPYMDYLLFRHKKRTRVALNLGGIANITIIPAGASPDQVVAFDTGPANMVIDQLIERHTNGRRRYDRNGAIGRRGKINEPLLKKLLRNPYYRKPAPKSCGREEYGGQFVNRMIASGLPIEDLIATATALTARTVAMATPSADDLIAAGGGAHNGFLMDLLRESLPNTRVTTTAEFGADPDAKEAIAFAVMAYEAWHRQTNNLPSATGARRPVIMGKISY
jgi:anhydro-N-acetylmuramic acid kinase